MSNNNFNDVVMYDRQLTQKEILNYELKPLSELRKVEEKFQKKEKKKDKNIIDF